MSFYNLTLRERVLEALAEAAEDVIANLNIGNTKDARTAAELAQILAEDIWNSDPTNQEISA